MNLRVKIYLFFVLTSCLLNVYAQNIENIDFYSEGKNVFVTYELKNCLPNEKYDISLVFVEKNTNQRVVPKMITGDLKNQVCGSKRIVWEISKDVSTLSGKFYPELNFKLAPKGPTDADGYVYKTVKIGNQEWFAENLRTSKYNDGTPIPNVTSDEEWSKLSTGAWCYYNNDIANNVKYGKLYNWYVVNPTTNGNKNICPTGWHVPTVDEWRFLTEYLGDKGEYKLNTGGKLKEIGYSNWSKPNKFATNSSKFNGLPGGTRLDNFDGIKDIGYWWSINECLSMTDSNASGLHLFSNNGYADISSTGKGIGQSIRCLKD